LAELVLREKKRLPSKKHRPACGSGEGGAIGGKRKAQKSQRHHESERGEEQHKEDRKPACPQRVKFVKSKLDSVVTEGFSKGQSPEDGELKADDGRSFGRRKR